MKHVCHLRHLGGDPEKPNYFKLHKLSPFANRMVNMIGCIVAIAIVYYIVISIIG